MMGAPAAAPPTSLGFVVAVAAAVLAAYVAFAQANGASSRWRQHRWLRVVAASAGVYAAADALLWLPVPDPIILACSRVAVCSAAVHVLAWQRYADIDLKPAARRARRLVELAIGAGVVLYAVPGVGLTGGVVGHTFAPLGLAYRVAAPTLFGTLVFGALTLVLGRTFLHYARATREHDAYAKHHLVALAMLLTGGVNDALVAVTGAHAPLLLDLAFCGAVAVLGRVVSRRWAADVRDLDAALRERDAVVAREQAARREAEAANHLKDVFVATVSHELRNPLNAILGWSELLADAADAPDARTSDLRRIQKNARTLAMLVEDLLDVSRLASGKVALHPTTVDVNATVLTALDVIRGEADARGVVVECDLASDVGPIVADPARLQQIVWNLAANGVKFTPAGGRVVVRTRATVRGVRLSVVDTGQGIAPELLPHVFERFRQAETSRKHGGLGLGLSIVRDLVALHGGRVTASSDGVGRGATFVVDLPTRRSPDDDRRITVDPPAPEA